jgi:lipoprotein-releasing system permease protein
MYKLILAIRYLYRRRISYFALGAVALCVFVVVVVMTVMTGLVSDFKKKNHNFTGDCVVGTESLVGFPYYKGFVEVLEKSDFVEAVSAQIRSFALVSCSERGWEEGLEVLGVNAEQQSRATGFGGTLYYHKADGAEAFVPGGDANKPGCVMGIDTWFQRDSHGEYFYATRPAATAIVVTCFPLTAKGALAKAGTGLVNSKTFYFSDVSQSGLARVDGSVIYIPFEDAQVLCGMKEPISRASRILIKFKPNVNLEEGCRKVRLMWTKFYDQMKGNQEAELLAGVVVQSWKEHRREFIAAMEKEQTMLTVMFGLVGVTTVFIIFVVFYMIVSHKTKDIGILKSVGASVVDVVGLFLGFAGMLGVVGSAVGIVGGLLFLRRINAIEGWLYERTGFQLWNRAIYAIGEIPHQVDAGEVLVIAGCAILACIAGAMLPSVRAAGAKPVETLQVNQL